MEPTTDTPENSTEPLTKERKKPNITPEDRAKRAERMRAMATSRNELLKKQKAERFEPTAEVKAKTPRAKKEKKTEEPVKELPTPVPDIPAPIPAKEPIAPQTPKKGGTLVKKTRTLIIQSSSDSEDYGDSDTSDTSDDDEPVIYIAKKKSKSAPKDKTITKAKPRAPEPVIAPPVAPAIRVKFF
jgi:hypothetical protein